MVDCKAEKTDICNAIEFILTDEYKRILDMSVNPFEGFETSDFIVREIRNFLERKNISCRKEFFDYARQ